MASRSIGSFSSERRSARTVRRDRGATLVEAAVVLPLLFVVIFALVEFGWAFKDSLSVGHGAREAARAGATFGNDPYTNFLVLQEIEEVMDPVGIADGLRVRIYNPVSGAGDNYVFTDGYAFGCDWVPCPRSGCGVLLQRPVLEPRQSGCLSALHGSNRRRGDLQSPVDHTLVRDHH